MPMIWFGTQTVSLWFSSDGSQHTCICKHRYCTCTLHVVIVVNTKQINISMIWGRNQAISLIILFTGESQHSLTSGHNCNQITLGSDSVYLLLLYFSMQCWQIPLLASEVNYLIKVLQIVITHRSYLIK